MPFLDFLRKVFIPQSTQDLPQERCEDDLFFGDSFRNPIWQSDEEEDDASDFRHPNSGFDFKIFTDPFEITRFYESQMDDLIKNFFHGFDSFGNGAHMFIPFHPGGNLKKTLPPPHLDQSKEDDLRVEVLKPEYQNPSSLDKKQDSDLDGRIASNDLMELWKDTSKSDYLDTPRSRLPIQSFSKSVSKMIIRKPDGSVEQRQSTKDSEGNENIEVTRTIGDKVHIITTKKAKDGTVVETEDIINIGSS